MNQKEETSRSMKKDVWYPLLLGLLIFGIAYPLLSWYDMGSASRASQEELNLLRQRVVRFEGYQANDETKSLVRLLDKTNELSQRLARASKQNVEFLDEYAYEQRLDGIIVTDENRDIVLRSSGVPEDEDIIEQLHCGENIQEIILYPAKHYITRTEWNGVEYDVVAVARQDEETGVVLCYFSKNSIKNNANDVTFDVLLDGYNFELNGVGGISDGESLVSANDEMTERLNALVPLLENTLQKDNYCTMLHFWYQNQKWYGSVSNEIEGYTLYILFPSNAVYETRNMVMMWGIFLFILFWLAYLLVRSRAAQESMRRVQEREHAYQEQLRRSVEEAERASQVKTDFLRRMSHDVRTPINGIRGMIEIGNHYADDLEKQAECRQKIWNASGFLLELVNSVLDMSKLESGEIELEEKPFDMLELVQTTRDILYGQAQSSHIEMELIEPEIQHRYLIGSPLHLRQVLQNIASNAIKYNKENGSVTLLTREIASDGETATFEFISRDTGIGMSPEFQKRAFEPFTQEEASARTKYQGSGLGLSICHQLVEQMGGSIHLESEQGVGSTFTITLQFRIDAERQKQEQTDAAETVTAAGMNVLLAEDNELNMEIAEFLLQREGVNVTKAWNGQEAVERFAQSEPGALDVILMDVMMPVMGGIDATKAIRAMERPDAKTIPIFAMTANAFADDIARSRAAGMNEYIAKPLDMEKLRQTLSKYKKK